MATLPILRKSPLLLVFMLVISLVANCSSNKTGIPLAEHPRPDFMRDAWLNLNGQWDFALDPLEEGEQEAWYRASSAFDKKITVPFSWASPFSGIEEPDVNIGWYSRTFTIPENSNWSDKRIFIVIGASDYETKLWLNGSLISDHEGGYTPFEFELTDLINRTDVNTVVIRVEDKSVSGRQTGKQNDYGPAKGIWQTVYLEGRSENWFRLVHFTPDIDNEKVSVKFSLEKPADNDMIIAVIFENQDLEPAQRTIPAGNDEYTFDIPVTDQRLWTLDDPYLYNVDVILGDGSEEYDRVRSYFGMRKISTGRPPGSDDMYIMLNNKPVYLKMTLDQAFHPESFYTFPSDDFIREEILRAKNIGLNGIRIHIKTEMPRKLYWADKLGVLVQADIPNFRLNNETGIADEYAKNNWKYTAYNQIMRDFNHPSIFCWVLFNETWGLEGRGQYRGYPQENREWVISLYNWAKELDPTRLVEDNSPDKYDHIVSDINCWHRYLPAQIYASFLDNAMENTYPGSGWNYIGDNVQTDIPLLNTECGAEHGYRYGTGDIDISFEYHIMINEFRRRLTNVGFVFTQFHDVIDEWNGYYRYDRTIKEWGLDELSPGMTINDFHSDMYLIPGNDFFKTVQPGDSFSIPITASFTTDELPHEMTVRTVVHGWNKFGEQKEYWSGQFTIQPKPYSVFDVEPVTFQAPNEECLAVMYTYLLDDQGQIRHRNFIPFRVVADDLEQDNNPTPSQYSIRREPDAYSQSNWSVKQVSILDGLKVWGTGTGYFEYEFNIPEDLTRDDIQDIEFLAELSSRHIQGKYTREGDELEYTGKHYESIGENAFDPGYGFNTFPMTDDKMHSSRVTITLNERDAQIVVLSDDPADHRGLLSWMNQIRPVSMAHKDYRAQDWELEEAGSYGYIVKVNFNEDSIEKAFQEKKFTIKLAVLESSETSGGLSVYGDKFGRFPLGPTVVITKKSQ